MEKRKTNLTIEDFEDKRYGEGKKAGRYTRFKTDQGWISSFDKPAIEKLKDSVYKTVSVEIQTDKDDKDKITKFYGEANDDDDEVETIRPGEQKRKSVKGSAYEKDPVGLTIELFNAMWPAHKPNDTEAVMELAIDLVKQARESFE